MRIKLIILSLFVSSTVMSFAQKKSTYFISPVSVDFVTLSSKGEQKNIANNAPQNAVRNEVNPVKKAIRFEDADEQTKIDMYYIAYLIKTQLLNSRYQKEVMETYDMSDINKIVDSYSDRELRNLSKSKSKEVYRYRL